MAFSQNCAVTYLLLYTKAECSVRNPDCMAVLSPLSSIRVFKGERGQGAQRQSMPQSESIENSPKQAEVQRLCLTELMLLDTS